MQLLIERGGEAGRRVSLSRGVTVIGRGQDCDVVLRDTQASRHHAELRRQGEQWWIVDLGSTNGTFVAGVQLRPDEPELLRPGTRVSIGDTEFVLQGEAVGDTTPMPLALPDEPREAAGPAAVSPIWGAAAWLARVIVAGGAALVLIASLRDWVRVVVQVPLLGTVMNQTYSGMDAGLAPLFMGAAGVALVLMLLDVLLRRWGVAAGLGQALAAGLAAASVGLSAYRYYELGKEQVFGVSLIDIVTRYAKDAVHVTVLPAIRLLAIGLAAVILGGVLRLIVASLEPVE